MDKKIHTTEGCNIIEEILNINKLFEVVDELKKAELISYLEKLDQPKIVKAVKEWGLPSKIIISHHLATDKVKEIFSRFGEVGISRACADPSILFFWKNQMDKEKY